MTPATQTLSILRQLFTAERHHLIQPGTILTDLPGWDDAFAHGLANKLETDLRISEIGARELQAWNSIADVIASVERRVRVDG